MAVAFTSLASWEHAQDTDAAQEIILAYSERRQCVGDAAIDDLEPGDAKQDTTFWRGVQDWIETNCVKWVDDANFSTSTEYDSPSDIAYTLATFRTEAGFQTDGFRRATEWPTDWTNAADAAYSFGKITAGDIVGPWIFEDLQKAFDAMRWTFKTAYTAKNLKEKSLATEYENDYDDAVANWPSAWDSGFDIYVVESNINGVWYTREYGDAEFATVDHINHSASGYYWMREYLALYEPFADIDGLGMVYHKYFPVESFTSASATTRTITQLTNIDTVPPYYSDGASAEGLPVLILKWEFTNTL